MADPKGEQLLDRLREYVQEQGGELAPGWRVEVKKRNSGTSAGTSDAYYFNPAGQRFRSRQEIVRHLETAAQQSKKVTRQEAAFNATEAAAKLGKQPPLTLDNGITVARLGSIDGRPSYHSQTQLWPVGYQASWQDAAVGAFQCNIIDGGDEGPRFAVSLVPPQADQSVQSLVEARDIDAAWQELAAIQQAGLDAALAAQSKARKPTSCKAAPAATTAAELQPQPHDSNGHAEGSLVLPDQGAAGQAGNGLAASDNGHLASEENQAANRQMSGSASMPATSMSKDQKPECAPKAAQPSLGEPDTASVPNGSHAEADSAPEQPEEVDEATAVKRQVLIKAAPLAGGWGLERFGFADITVLKLLEALPGVEEHCKEYRYVEQRQGWEAEQRRLKKELEKHNKQATKASKGVEKKGAKLLSIEATAKVKAAQAEAKQEAKAAAKRKRQEDKQAEKAELKRAKTEQGQEHKSAKEKPEGGSALKAAGRAPASTDAKPKPRARSGMDKTERDVHHVLYKMIGQVERQYNRDVEKAAVKAEKEAAKVQRHREREEQRQAKQAAAEHSKPKREATADAAVPSQHAHTTAAVLATDVEDSKLPGFAKQLPPPDPIGTGLLSPQQMSGLLEVREFLARFVDQNPDLADLEAAFADPTGAQHHMQLLTDVHLPLLELVVEEAFQAAIDVAGQENLDVRLHEMRFAMPPLKGDSWPELVRRYFALAATAAMVKSTEASGGLDTALGALVGATPLSLLGPFAVLQSLTAGAHTGEPTDAGAARLPLGASRTAPEASQVKQDAAALAAAEKMLAASGGGVLQDEAARRHTIITCRRMLLELASIKGPKAEGGHASARSLSFDAQSAAAAARSGVPIDLMTVAARVDAGVYCNNAQGVEAFAANVQSVCDLFRAASRRSNSSFGSELVSKGVPAMADLISARMDKLMSQHHGLAVPDQAPTPGKKLKKGGSAESSPGSSQPGSRDEKAVNIVEDLARPFAPWEGCCVCWEDEDRKHILLCDKCDAEYHTYCLDPPLEEVPEGEWFCPRCRSELELDSTDQPIHASLVPTRLMKQEDCYRSLAAALGQKEYEEMTAQQRVQIAVLLCSLAASAACTRTQLTDAEDSRKEMRKEQLALRTKLRREEKERAAAAAADAAEAQSAPAAQGKEAADKAAKKLEGNARTRAKQQADAAAELQKDLARIEELTVEIRKCSLRKDMLGYDRHWSRYWLLEGSCPEAVTSDESPDSCWVYVERCHWPPGENQQHRESPDDEEEDLPLGQLAQQAQHDGEAPQRAKRRKVQIPDDQGGAVSWGCYKTVEHVSRLINFLNSTGVRESQLQKALLRIRPKLPTEASLAAATAATAAAAAAAAREAKQKAVETAQAEQASTVSVVAKPDTQHETHSLVKTDPSTQTDPSAPTGPPAEAADVIQNPSSGAVPPPGAVAPAQEGPSAGAVPDPMDVDIPGLAPALDSKVDPESAEPAEAAQTAESDKQPSAELPLSDLEKCRLDLGAAANSLPPEAFDPVCGSEARQHQWQLLVAAAMRPQELMAATLLLEGMLRGERFKPHWRICNMPAPSPSNAGSFAAVRMRLQALRAAIKKTVSSAAGAVAVTREAAREAAAHPHGGGGYSFRGRKAAGALAEPSPEDSAEEEAAPAAAAKPTRAGVKRGRAAAKHADGVEEDEALARRLQEQEDALATRGRATRGALRVPQKPSQAVQKGSSRDARQPRGLASAGVRSSSRLKPQPTQGKQRPVTRGSTEVRTTRSRAEEETYSSSGEDEEADSASEPEGSDLESSPASSAKQTEPQDQDCDTDEEQQSGSSLGSDHGSAAPQDAVTKKSRNHASAATRSSRDPSLGRGSSVVLETKAFEGRRRLRKAS